MPDFTLETEHGIISITDSGLKNSRPALLLLHGNSSSSRIFTPMLASPTLSSQYRLITFDLPGHGASSNAPQPGKTYSMAGYADLAAKILEHLSVERVVVLGWSLGGHVALEMVGVLRRASERGARIVMLEGILLVGAPPALGAAQCARGFKAFVYPNTHPDPDPPSNTQEGEERKEGQEDENEGNLMASPHWTPSQASRVAHFSAPGGHTEFFEDWMLRDALRTDGRARMHMFDAFLSGRGADQVKIVETEDVPIAVVNGADEPFVDLDYLDGIMWKKLWRGQCVRLEGRRHAPFWEDPGAFEVLLVDFLEDCGGRE